MNDLDTQSSSAEKVEESDGPSRNTHMRVSAQTRLSEKDIDQLLVACQQGNRQAFEQLFEAHKARVYSLAFHFTGNDTAARDIVQEVFLKLLTGIHTYRPEMNFTPWLYRVVVNACVDDYRSRRRYVPYTDAMEVQSIPTGTIPDAAYFRQQIGNLVGRAVRSLKPDLRIPLILRHVEELSYEEIAGVLGCSKGTVASRLNRAHSLLACKLAALRRAQE